MATRKQIEELFQDLSKKGDFEQIIQKFGREALPFATKIFHEEIERSLVAATSSSSTTNQLSSNNGAEREDVKLSPKQARSIQEQHPVVNMKTATKPTKSRFFQVRQATNDKEMSKQEQQFYLPEYDALSSTKVLSQQVYNNNHSNTPATVRLNKIQETQVDTVIQNMDQPIPNNDVNVKSSPQETFASPARNLTQGLEQTYQMEENLDNHSTSPKFPEARNPPEEFPTFPACYFLHDVIFI